MSGRAVRKALRQREAELLQSQTPEENAPESDEEEPAIATPLKQSLFALLDIADEHEEREQDEEDEEAESESAASKPVLASAKKSKKKKKGKGKAKEDDGGAEGEDDIDRALRQLNLAVSSDNARPSPGDKNSAVDVPLSGVLKIDSRNLDAENEMKRLFGREALRPADAGQGSAVGRRRGDGRIQMVPGIAGGRALNKGRRNTFLQPKDEWPNASSGGLGMEIEDSDSATGVTTYKFVHSRTYQGVQREFMMRVASMDPQRLINLLQHNPYHITTLLQCSEIFHHQRDFTIAGDLLERAMFALGRSLHSSFQQKLAEGSARLSFRRPENRELFLCGWRYIKNLSQRGTWRTAEEYARLLLAMDPEGDPYEMCLLVDFLALKARHPERLIALVEHPSLRRKYSDLPNIAFSSALAHLQLGNESLAFEYLSKAITKFPWIPTMLYQELSVYANLPPALWGIQPPEENPRQEILAKLYVERTKDIWKQPAFTTFLVDTSSTIHTLPRKPLLGSSSPDVSLSLARHVALAEIQPLVSLLPLSIKTRETAAFDPFPPDNNLKSYDPTLDELPVISRARQMGVGGGDGMFSTFLRSILPWFRVEEGGMVDRRELTDDERRQVADLRAELEMMGVDVEGMLDQTEQDEGQDETGEGNVEAQREGDM